MKCKHCGAEIANDSVFCEYCGKRVKQKSKKWKWAIIIPSIVVGVCLNVVGAFLLIEYSEILLKSGMETPQEEQQYEEVVCEEATSAPVAETAEIYEVSEAAEIHEGSKAAEIHEGSKAAEIHEGSKAD